MFLAAAFAMAACSDSDTTEQESGKSKFEPIVLSRAEQDVVSRQNSFSADLFGKVADDAADSKDNFMVSPLSVSMVMSMLANGAQGETLDEIVNAIGFSGIDMDAVNTFNKRLNAELAAADKATKLSLANSIWIDNSFNVFESYISDNKQAYGAEIFNVELTTEKTRKTINKWAYDKTNGLIPEFLKTTLDNPALFLMNALYFKGTWAEKFDKSLTAEGNFYNADGTVGHPMMMQAPRYEFGGCYDDKGASWAKFGYGNGAYELVLILPDHNVTLTDYLHGLDKGTFTEMADNGAWENYKGRVVFPKFEIHNELQLKDIMIALGMRKAFNRSEADFSLISENPTSVSGIKHETRIIFSEEGTEAAAVTGTTLDTIVGPLPSQDLTFDRPFAFFIRERSTKSILFMGCVNKL